MNNYLMIFDFIDGNTLNDHEIANVHCEKIGEILAQIHNLKYDELNLDSQIKEDKFRIDWLKLLDIANEMSGDADWLELDENELLHDTKVEDIKEVSDGVEVWFGYTAFSDYIDE